MPATILESAGLEVRVGEDAIKSVGFVGRVNNGVFTPCGTGFLGGITKNDAVSVVLVTAAHVLDGPSDEFCVRLTDKSGKSLPVHFDRTNSFFHDDVQNDVVLVPLQADPSIFDFKLIRLDPIFYRDWLKTYIVPDVGDVVSTVGLYTSHYGLEKNAPVVRTGNIAAMPGEPVMTETGYVRAYLIETRSIAGLSGSPVYLNAPSIRRAADGAIESLTKPALYPIGIMLGYHLVISREDQIQVAQFQKTQSGQEPRGLSLDERNTGFGVAVPIERVFEIMESDRFKLALDNVIVAKRKSSGFKPASVGSPAQQEDGPNPNHKGDFTALLDAAARKPK